MTGLAVIYGISGRKRIVGLRVIFVRGSRVGVVMCEVLSALGGGVGAGVAVLYLRGGGVV